MLPLVAKGPTTGEVSAHFEEIFGASLSKDTISRITDPVMVEPHAFELGVGGVLEGPHVIGAHHARHAPPMSAMSSSPVRQAEVRHRH